MPFISSPCGSQDDNDYGHDNEFRNRRGIHAGVRRGRARLGKLARDRRNDSPLYPQYIAATIAKARRQRCGLHLQHRHAVHLGRPSDLIQVPSRHPSLPGALHVDPRTRHRCPLLVEQPRCPSAVAGGGCSVGVDDTPPRHVVVEQAHRPSHLPWARTDSLADVTVGGDETSWDGGDCCTDIFDDAHVGIRPEAGR